MNSRDTKYKQRFCFMLCNAEARIRRDLNFTKEVSLIDDYRWKNHSSTIIIPYNDEKHPTIQFKIQRTSCKNRYHEVIRTAEVAYLQIDNDTITLLDELFRPTNESVDIYLFSNEAINIAMKLLSNKSFQIDATYRFANEYRLKYTPGESYAQIHEVHLKITRNATIFYYVEFKDGKHHFGKITHAVLDSALKNTTPLEEYIIGDIQRNMSLGLN